MDHRRYERSTAEIIGDLFTQFPALVRKESQLARAEMSEKISQVGFGATFIVCGAVLLIPALVVLLQAAVTALEQYQFQPIAAALIVGGAVLLIGIILLIIGITRLKVENLVPNKTIHQIQQDASAAKQQLRSGHEHHPAA